MSTDLLATPATFGHDMDRGFCSVCGAVWPCSQARRELESRRSGQDVRHDA